MPIGLPRLEGGKPMTYEGVLFGPDGQRPYLRFLADRII